MTYVKICSIQDVAHAFAAAEAGADFVGFNFVPGVRRQLPEEKARAMIQAFRRQWGDRGPRLVGIFVDQPIEEVNRMLETCGLDMAQLSGGETPDYVRGLARPVLKAIQVPVGRPVADVARELDGVLAAYEQAGATPLLDPEVTGHHGGAGQAFDWAIAKALAQSHRFLLAGGLTPENVADAVRQVQPWGVDVSSGVETGGVKDVAKIRAFVANAKAATRPFRVLFVCGGNTCRSPMAAALARKALGDAVQADSAGLEIRETEAAPDAVDVAMDLLGVDLSGHVPAPLSRYFLSEYDVIVAMTPSVAYQLGVLYPLPADRLVVWSVSDPYGQGRAAYERCARQLAQLVEGFIAERALPRRG
ncbi:MAG: hypothetical protein HY681_00050 [Chloroflexi bacterium]|nr:hypothetical protein [Chloroflexota bacterium]